MIRGVLFDLGDIFFEAHFWRKWNYKRLKNKGFFKGSFAEFYNLYENFLEDAYIGEIKYEKAFYNFLKSFNINNIENFIEESLIKKKYYEDNRKLYTGVKRTLAILKKRQIKNIIITDNELPEIEIRVKLLEKLGINHLIDKVVTSFECRAKKPNPEIFYEALRLSHLKINEVIFVAHDKDEIDGAKEIGIKVIEYNNYLKQPNSSDIKISKFSEILEIIPNE